MRSASSAESDALRERLQLLTECQTSTKQKLLETLSPLSDDHQLKISSMTLTVLEIIGQLNENPDVWRDKVKVVSVQVYISKLSYGPGVQNPTVSCQQVDNSVNKP